MRRDPLGIFIVSRVLHGAEVPDLVLLRDNDEAARMLAGRALDIDAAGRESVFLGLADGHLALGEVFFNVAVGCFFRDRADGSGAEHVVGAEHLDAVGVRPGLILAREVEVDIGDLVAAEAEERFKRDVEAVFI